MDYYASRANAALHRERYLDYIHHSPRWAALRSQVYNRAGGTCERCGLRPVENCHHLTYARLFHEELEDLAGLCRPCHEFAHHQRDQDPMDEPLLKTIYDLLDRLGR